LLIVDGMFIVISLVCGWLQ